MNSLNRNDKNIEYTNDPDTYYNLGFNNLGRKSFYDLRNEIAAGTSINVLYNTGGLADMNSLDSAHIADSAITYNVFASGSVSNSKIANKAITTAKMASNAATSSCFTGNDISDLSNIMASGAITEAKIANDAIQGWVSSFANIFTGTLEDGAFANNSVAVLLSADANSLASTAVTPGNYTNVNVTVDAAGRVTAAASG